MSLCKVNKTMEEQECPICFDENYLKQSATLPCGHKICSVCVASIAVQTHSSRSSNVLCPLCRAVVVTIQQPSTFHLELEDHERHPMSVTELSKIAFFLLMVMLLPPIVFHFLFMILGVNK